VLVATFSVLLVLGAGVVPAAAYFAGHSLLTAAALVACEMIGLAFVGFGLLGLAFEGYAEGAGSSLPVALPLLALGLTVMAGGWLVARATP
jgi:hypothetical protein